MPDNPSPGVGADAALQPDKAAQRGARALADLAEIEDAPEVGAVGDCVGQVIEPSRIEPGAFGSDGLDRPEGIGIEPEQVPAVRARGLACRVRRLDPGVGAAERTAIRLSFRRPC